MYKFAGCTVIPAIFRRESSLFNKIWCPLQAGSGMNYDIARNFEEAMAFMSGKTYDMGIRRDKSETC